MENREFKPARCVSKVSGPNPEFTTVWSFGERGAWATHTPSYRGNFAPQVARNVIEMYSAPGGNGVGRNGDCGRAVVSGAQGRAVLCGADGGYTAGSAFCAAGVPGDGAVFAGGICAEGGYYQGAAQLYVYGAVGGQGAAGQVLFDYA